MRDIFICPHGNLLENWIEACPGAMVSTSALTVPVNEPVLFWVHANASNQAWLERTMADIARKFQVSKVVVLANTPHQAEAMAMLGKGASGYCHAYSPVDVLKELKTVVTHGGIWLGRELLQTLIAASKPLVHNAEAEVQQALALLTPREKEVALQAAKGLSNKEIARVLDITERTVKAHVSATLERLGLKDRLQLALVLNSKAQDMRLPQAITSKPVKDSKPKASALSEKPLTTGVPLKKKLELAV